MNKWIGTGRLTREPEIRRNNDNVCANYTLAVERKYKTEGQPTADFVRCVAWGNSAEFIEKHLHKGMKMLVVGRLHTGSYKDKDGKTIYTTDIIVEDHEFCESKGAGTNESTDNAFANGFSPIPDGVDEELPFA